MACVVSAALVACKYDQGIRQPLAPLAGLRYVNLVNDTGAVDFRIVNFIGDAPTAGAATYRTGGAPYGVSTNFLPPHFSVEAGRDVQIRVFMNGTEPSVTSDTLYDTTCTFTAGVNYTFFLYGNARTVGGVHSLVTVDTLPAPAGVAFRVVNLGGSAQDVDIVAQTVATPLVAPLPGTANFVSVLHQGVTAYTNFAVSATLKAITTAPNSRTPSVAAANAPAGVAGTATLNPVAGTNVAGSAITAVIVPASVVGSTAPQTAAFLAPTVLFMIDKKPLLTAP